jgi:hypothetical protein
MDLKEAKKNVAFLRRQLISSIKNDAWSMSFERYSNSSDESKGKRFWENEKFKICFDTSYKESGEYEIKAHIKSQNNNRPSLSTVDWEVLDISRFRMWFLRRFYLMVKGTTFEEEKRRKNFESRIISVAHEAQAFMNTHKGVVRDEKINDLLQK